MYNNKASAEAEEKAKGLRIARRVLEAEARKLRMEKAAVMSVRNSNEDYKRAKLLTSGSPDGVKSYSNGNLINNTKTYIIVDGVVKFVNN